MKVLDLLGYSVKKSIFIPAVLLFFLNLSTAFSQPPLSPNSINGNGEREGEWTLFFRDDFTPVDDQSQAAYYRIINYKNGKPVGDVIDYYITGEIQWVGSLISDNPDIIKDGFAVYYYKNGNKSGEGMFKNGKRDGHWIEWDESGGRGDGTYKDGRENGTWTHWDRNGNKSSVGPFENGRRNGYWKEWYEYGGRGEGVYKEGKEEGLWTIFDSRGNKKGEGNFKNGLMHGPWIFRGDQGGKSAGKFVNDIKEGKWVFWRV